MNRTLLFVFMIFIISTIALIGCQQVPERPKDELVVAIGSEPEGGFDPTTGWGRYGTPLFQSTLIKRDDELKIAMDLATDYEVSEDGLSWTFHLRDDVVFSDGEPFSADDVVYTFTTMMDNASVVDLTILKAVEAVDEKTVRFELHHPQSTFVNVIAKTGIVPKHAHGADYAEHPIGSGPFMFVQWDKGQQLIIEKNPLYYGEQPHFNKITFLYLNEESTFAAAKAGQVDIATITPILAKQSVKGMHLVEVATVDNRGILFPYVKSGEVTEEGYPIGNDVTADKAIRQAINVAIDRQALIDGVLEGHGSPAYTVNDGLPWWNPDSVVADGDLEAAKNILVEAGWVDTNGDGIVEKAGLVAQFQLLYPAGDQTRQSLAIATADMLKPLGIDIQVDGKSWDELARLMYSNAMLMGWGNNDPLEMYNLYSSTTRGFDYYNVGYYSNKKVDEYMEQALSALDEETANEYWKKAQWDGETGVSAKGDAPWAWLVNVNHLYVVRDGLSIGKQQVHPHGHGWPLTDNITEWQWEQ